jgi:hypothetical protein
MLFVLSVNHLNARKCSLYSDSLPTADLYHQPGDNAVVTVVEHIIVKNVNDKYMLNWSF